MKHKPESWNSATAESQRGVRRSLTRAGLQLGQLSHVVSGALTTLQSGAGSRGAAQTRMRELLNQDRALLAHRACGQALLLDEAQSDVPRNGKQSRGAAQTRMRELLNQDRALLALRRANAAAGSGPKAGDRADADHADLVHADPVNQAELPAHAPAGVFQSNQCSVATVLRGSCGGATTSFAPDTTQALSGGPSVAVGAQALVDPEPHLESQVPVAPVVDAPTPNSQEISPEPPTRTLTQKSIQESIQESIIEAPQTVVAPGDAAPLPPAITPAPTAASEHGESAPEPIRTRSMAKLLAMQGYRDRALSIYDDLLAVEPDNTELRTEADRLRN